MPSQNDDLKRSFFQRLFGKSATPEPLDTGCWSFSSDHITLDLDLTPELSKTGTAVRLEGRDLPVRVLVVHGDDGNYYAFDNCCRHGKRRLDPVPGSGTIQCCSIGKSTHDYRGRLLRGSAEEDLPTFATRLESNSLIITLP